MVEIMVSLAIALFLLTGLTAIFSTANQTFIAQGQLRQLQNNQILAMNIIGNIVQSAGYYPNSQLQTQITVLPVQTVAAPLAVNFAAGQAVFGGSVNGADSIAVRSIAAMDCSGNTGNAAPAVVSTFSVSNSNLQCSINGQAPQTLVSGVAGMSLLYGVDPTGSGSATQYVPAANVTAWGNIMSVSVTLNFVNPLGQPATIPFTRVIGVMGQL